MSTYEKRRRWFLGGISAFAWMAFMAWFASPAHAELIGSDTIHAYQDWFGTKSIQFHEESNGKYVDGSIDFVVYAPGDFNLSFPGQDPSNGTQYVYRFQLNNDAGTNNDYMKKLTLGLVGITGAANCKWIEPDSGPYSGGGVAPANDGLAGTPNPTSAFWSYSASNPIIPGSYSKMLIFTSPNGPTFRLATVNSQSTMDHWVDGSGNQYNWWEGELPSPVPEPSLLIGLLAAAGCLIVYRTLKSNRRCRAIQPRELGWMNRAPHEVIVEKN